MWKTLNDKETIDQLIDLSSEKPFLLFKYSTRCGLSLQAHEKLKEWDFKAFDLDIYFLDLIKHRDVSNYIAEKFQVIHQSPQVLLLSKGKIVYHTSHHQINNLQIQQYLDFQKVAIILQQIKSFMNTDSDIVWTRYNNIEQFLTDLNQDILNIEDCSFLTLEKVQFNFLPTSTYQEISISNNWGDHYLKLSNDFDILYKQLTERKNNS